MAPNRKSDVALEDKENSTLDNFVPSSSAPAAKKARLSDASASSSSKVNASSSTAKGKDKDKEKAPSSWQDVGEDEVSTRLSCRVSSTYVILTRSTRF
jgi:hypothetical protein